jgi:hypothetical protein
MLCGIRICASFSDKPFGNGLMVKLVFLNLSMRMLSIAVEEQSLIINGKSTVLSICHMMLIGSPIEICYCCCQDN